MTAPNRRRNHRTLRYGKMRRPGCKLCQALVVGAELLLDYTPAAARGYFWTVLGWRNIGQPNGQVVRWVPGGEISPGSCPMGGRNVEDIVRIFHHLHGMPRTGVLAYWI